MINYFLYRINSGYDGFTPSQIPKRTKNKRLIYNWRAYFESIDKGDVILTYFHGSGVKKGIYAVTRVRACTYGSPINHVSGSMIYSSFNNEKPLISYEENPELFQDLSRLRPRGAEIVIPKKYESKIYDLIKSNQALLHSIKKSNVRLPGSPDQPSCDITEIPRIKKTEFINNTDYELIPTFWVKPRQASWMRNGNVKLNSFTTAFEKFKAGDKTHIQEFADSIEDQIKDFLTKEDLKNIGLITSVPLNNSKKKHGELDRVWELTLALAERMQVQCRQLFTLKGDVSRRMFKNLGYSKNEFIRDYIRNLVITSKSPLLEIAKYNKKLIIVDDVITDGLTTQLIARACKDIAGTENIDIIIVTLGMMSKKNNCSNSFIRRHE